MVFRIHYFLIFYFFLVLHVAEAQTVTPAFNFPSNICAGQAFNITNTTTGGSTFKWNFCAKNLNREPAAQNIGNPGGLNQPVYMDIVFTNNNYYGFVTNFSSGNLVRLDFGNSLKNNPVAVIIDLDGPLPGDGNSGIQVVQNEGKWYAIILSGYPPGGIAPRISKVEFGNSITNTAPTVVNWGSIGNMYDPKDLIMVQEGSVWIGLTVNAETNTITRFNFGSSFNSPPAAENLGDLGRLSEPSGLFVTNDNGNTVVFITNSGDEDRIHGQFDITRLEFGSSLLNSDPNAVNIGNVGNMLQHPRDIVIAPFCNEMVGYVLNGHPFYNSLLKLNFGTDFYGFPVADDMGNLGSFAYPHSITDFFTEGGDLVAFVVNKENSTITRIVFADCNNASIATSTVEDPPPISYNQAGVYNVQLLVDEGLSSEVLLCQEVVVTSCVDTLIITNDTTICAGTDLTILTHPDVSYQWTPASFLNDPTLASPTTSTRQSIKYYLDAMIEGESLVMNGSFTNGNNDFTSGYSYTPTNVVEGEYFIGNDPRTWNISLDYCNDHTTGTGPMMLVNGSQTAGTTIWSETITVKPNTDYIFSAWLESVWAPNPANVQFVVNGAAVGTPVSASLPACNWSKAFTTWNSGVNTNITISMVNLNTAIVGNDFAIDDIVFAELIPVRDSITINVRQAFIKANEDTTICAGQAVQLEVAQGSFFAWTPTAGLNNALVPNPIAAPEITTEYIVSGIDPGGCAAKDTVVINVVQSPVVSLINDTVVCKGTSLQLQATGGGDYEWTPAASLSSAVIAQPVTQALLNDVTYSVKVTGMNGCYQMDSVMVTVRPYPEFAASGTSEVCAGDQAVFQASGGDVYSWSPASIFADPSQQNITFIPTASQTYTVKISDSVCRFDTSIVVRTEVNPVPEVVAKKSNDINCTVPSAVLEVSGATSYSWAPAASLSDPASSITISNADTTTNYIVTGSNEYGCSSSATLTIAVDKSGAPRFVVPNAFSPNNDGKNDCFGIQRWGNAEIKQFSIYNRWGTIVFQTTDASRCWDGTSKGKAQEGGGYVYVIRANTICGEVVRKGMVTLIR